MKAQDAGEGGVSLGKDHEVVVALAELDLVVLQLWFFAYLYAAHSENATTHTACKNTRKGNALAQVPIPEHVYLRLLFHYCFFHIE